MFGERIQYLRKKAGLSQSLLAEKLNDKYGLNIERSMISKWETGTQTPTMYYVKCMAEYFGVSIDYLTGTEKPSEMDGKAHKVVTIINQLNEQNLDRAVDFLTILLQSQ